MKVYFACSRNYQRTDAVSAIADELRTFGHLVSLDAVAARRPEARGNLLPKERSPDVLHLWGSNDDEDLSLIHDIHPGAVVIHLEQARGHPLLKRAAAVTSLTDHLDGLVRAEIPRLLLWPGADPKLFFSRPKDLELLERFRVPVNSTVLCYAGDVTVANMRDVRSLYLAVAILNREGLPAILIRAGRDHCAFLGVDEQWARKYSIELGRIPHEEVPHVLSLADILVQPGRNDAANDFYLPITLPELFAAGRPLILPRRGIGRFVQNEVHGLVMVRVDALTIVEAVKRLHGDEALRCKLAQAAIEFNNEFLHPAAAARKLDAFYRAVCSDNEPQQLGHIGHVTALSGKAATPAEPPLALPRAE